MSFVTIGPQVPEVTRWAALAALVVITIGYLHAARRERNGRRGWSGWRTGFFVAGSAVIAAGLSPWLSAWAAHDLRGHMAQHLLLGMFGPLGLVLGAPVTLFLRSIPVRAARRVTGVLHRRGVRVLTHPFAALLLDVGVLWVLFLTPLYALTHSSALLSGVLQAHFVLAGALFAWSIAGPDPAPGRPAFRTRLVALVLAIAAHSSLAKVMYAFGWPRGTHHTLEEIRVAAQWMYYGGDLAELLLAVALFTGWYRRRGAARSAARAPRVALAGAHSFAKTGVI